MYSYNLIDMPKIKDKELFTGSDKLKRSLPHGAIMKIARKYGLSYAHVWNVANGKANTYDERVLTDLKALAEIENRITSKVYELV